MIANLHLTPMTDQERVSPYSINTISNKQVMRMKEKSITGLRVDPTPKFFKLTS